MNSHRTQLMSIFYSSSMFCSKFSINTCKLAIGLVSLLLFQHSTLNCFISYLLFAMPGLSITTHAPWFSIFQNHVFRKEKLDFIIPLLDPKLVDGGGERGMTISTGGNLQIRNPLFTLVCNLCTQLYWHFHDCILTSSKLGKLQSMFVS